jgi:hypothetical protein
MAMEFEVEGPIEMPSTRGRGGRTITREDTHRFWHSNSQYAERRGCYVFCIRNAGLKVFYVGKASRDFQSEIFTPHKLGKYHSALANCAKGTPLLFLVMTPLQRGPVNHSAIEECEDWLIWNAKRANPRVQNDRGGAAAPFAIPHVTDRGRGRPTRGAIDLCRALDILPPSAESQRRGQRCNEMQSRSDSQAGGMTGDTAVENAVARVKRAV